jgi:hypothetical protein
MMFHRTNHVTRAARCLACASVMLSLAVGCGGDEPYVEAQPANDDVAASAQGLTGNDAPSGAHFNLNIIGVPKNKSASITEGGRIFVPLTGNSKILLSEGDFAVLDANGTDGTAAFQLPAPDPDGDGSTSYSVFARALGKPGGSATVTTCATDAVTGEEICSAESLVAVRTSGRQKFENVSRELLFIDADSDGDGVTERVSLFDDALDGFLWQVDNQGLRLLQLRLYEVPTAVE